MQAMTMAVTFPMGECGQMGGPNGSDWESATMPSLCSNLTFVLIATRFWSLLYTMLYMVLLRHSRSKIFAAAPNRHAKVSSFILPNAPCGGAAWRESCARRHRASRDVPRRPRAWRARARRPLGRASASWAYSSARPGDSQVEHCLATGTSVFSGSTRHVRDADAVALKQAALKIIALGGALADLAMQVIDLLPVLRELLLARRARPSPFSS